MATPASFICGDLTPHIASELKAAVATLLSGEFSAEIRALLEERGVVAFRGLNLNDEQQLAFTKTLGTSSQKYEITKITMDPLENPNANYIKGAFFWHIDGTMIDTPIFSSVMSSRRLSEIGGQTEFSNTYAAYDDLPEEEKSALAKLKVVHMFETAQRYANPEPSYADYCDWQKHQPRTLPLIWTHSSGRKSLVLGSTASHIEGLDLRQGWALLTRLRDWATQPQFVYRHERTLCDLVIWDNTGTILCARAYPQDGGRLMYHTQTATEECIV